ncbi:MAG: hypothetical protein IPH23_10160 [Gammaproteobacteria bacterium]|nr:hypothetical protein [Gammaproteobacteria bacterium]MBK8132804.1 hypothetical protein [Gammaproteobacteria bacterium]
MSSDIEIQSTCAPSFSKVRDAFGHSGWGGSFGFADTRARLGMGYAMNQMDTNIFGDPRGVRLIEAAYGCLPRSQEMLR